MEGCLQHSFPQYNHQVFHSTSYGIAANDGQATCNNEAIPVYTPVIAVNLRNFLSWIIVVYKILHYSSESER